MNEIMSDLRTWRDQGKKVVVARVVDVEGSAPRAPGAAMAVSEDGEVAGSVSGGCVEGAVVATVSANSAGATAPSPDRATSAPTPPGNTAAPTAAAASW